MALLIPLEGLRGRPDFEAALRYINGLRSEYPWAARTYSAEDAKGVYLIRASKQCVGFLSAEVRNLELTSARRPLVYVKDFHIAAPIQKAGIGRNVLRHILGKGYDLEFVIATANEKAQGLVRKFPAALVRCAGDLTTVKIPGTAPNAVHRN